MRHNVKRRIAWSVAALVLTLPAGACGSGDGPDGALEDFADAINDQDDAAVKALTCESAYSDNGNTLADPLSNSPMDVDSIDPRLHDIHWTAEAGDITEQSDTEATGELSMTVEGIPDDLSPQAQQVLDSGIAPFPVGLAGQDHTVKLVKEGETWLVCD